MLHNKNVEICCSFMVWLRALFNDIRKVNKMYKSNSAFDPHCFIYPTYVQILISALDIIVRGLNYTKEGTSGGVTVSKLD